MKEGQSDRNDGGKEGEKEFECLMFDRSLTKSLKV
jgi:hypothetical protein